MKTASLSSPLPANAETSCRDRKHKTVKAAAVILSLLPQLAFAAAWDNVATKILEALNGGIARTVAIIFVIALGFVAMTGNLPWRWALSLITGIILVFGAASFVDLIIGAAA